MSTDSLIQILVVLAVVASVIAFMIVHSKKAKTNLMVLGDKLGLSLETQGRVLKTYRLSGCLRGKPVEIFSYTTGEGKSKRTWAAIVVRVEKTGGLTFLLKRRMPFLGILGKLFRKNMVETGDTAFDKKWELNTNQPGFMHTALLPEMREKIMRLGGGRYRCEHGTVQYAELSSFSPFSSAKLCARFEEVAGLVCDLADLVEVGADLQK